MLSAIVLAAGLSSRMGTINKLLLHYEDKAVITRVVENILAAGIKNVIVVTGHEAARVKIALDNLPVQFTHNPRYTEGMTTSIQQGIFSARGNGYMICLSDMVTVTSEDYMQLNNIFQKKILSDYKCICVPRFKNERGNPVIFSTYYRDAILDNKEPEGCKNIVQLNKKHIYFTDMDTPHILQDFDYPDDYKKVVS